MRALLDARVRLLPDGFELPDDGEEITPTEREALLADFLASPEGRRWHGDEDAEEVARMAIDFGAGYNHGGALRWSPVVVEIFMTSWLARNVTGDPELFARVPEILPDWVAYAGRRNGVPAAPLREAIAAVEESKTEMLAEVENPEAWGPAKTLAVAASRPASISPMRPTSSASSSATTTGSPRRRSRRTRSTGPEAPGERAPAARAQAARLTTPGSRDVCARPRRIRKVRSVPSGARPKRPRPADSDQRGLGGLGTPSCLQIAMATPGPISLWRGTTERPPAGPRHFV